jgi:hypothetical protein
MTARTLWRCCGLLALVVAILQLGLGILPSFLLPRAEPIVNWVLDSNWDALSVAAFTLAALLPLVLIALYAFQLEQTGTAGLVGFGLAFLGSILLLSFQFDMTFVWPVLADEVPRLLDVDGVMFGAPRFAFVHFWMGPLFTLGMLIFGAGMVRARVFPRWSSAVFTIGMILSAGILLPPLLLRLCGSLLVALSLIRIGLVMLEGRPFRTVLPGD